MPRRFLTSEDVRRAAGPEILVDDETVVTPQALEVAEAAGVVIRSAAGGSYAEPAPDRGPDSERARRHLPSLPEPTGEGGDEGGVVLTAVGRNRPGVLAEITGAVSEFGADVYDISQKELQGYFHLILTVQLPPNVGFSEFKEVVQCLGGEGDYVVRAMHERVFRFMHRV